MSALKGVKIQKKTIVVPMVVNCSISSAIAGTTLFRMAKKYPFKQAQTAINGRPGASRRRGSPLERSKKRCARKSDPIHRTPAAAKLTPRENSRQRRIQTGEPRHTCDGKAGAAGAGGDRQGKDGKGELIDAHALRSDFSEYVSAEPDVGEAQQQRAAR